MFSIAKAEVEWKTVMENWTFEVGWLVGMVTAVKV